MISFLICWTRRAEGGTATLNRRLCNSILDVGRRNSTQLSSRAVDFIYSKGNVRYLEGVMQGERKTEREGERVIV